MFFCSNFDASAFRMMGFSARDLAAQRGGREDFKFLVVALVWAYIVRAGGSRVSESGMGFPEENTWWI